MYNFNMDLFHIFCLICLGVSGVACAPLENATFYNAIVEQCPAVASNPKFKDLFLFKSCKNWEKISQVEALTDNNQNDVLCLLFFNSFTQYCSHAEKINTTVSIDLTLDLNTICDNLIIIPKNLDPENSLLKIITDESKCKKLCGDNFGLVMPICTISYSYNHKEITPESPSHMIPVQKESEKLNQESSNNNKNPNEKITQISEANKPSEDKGDPVKQNTNEITQNNEVVADRAKIDLKTQKTTTNKVGEAVESPNQNTDPVGDVSKIDTNANKNLAQVPNQVTPPENQPLVQHIEAEAKQNPPQTIDKAPDVDVDQDMGLGEEGMQPNNRPESEEDMEEQPMPNEKLTKPAKIDETEAVNYTTDMDGDSYFFTYFMLLCVIFIVGYVCYHNKQKILALILEGRKGKRQYRGRRPNSANYHKLDSNLEEAITSSCNKNTNNVIY